MKTPTETRDQAQLCVLVLGMHRSGTSMVTRLLNLAGLHLPDDLLGADRGNEEGHWEPFFLMARNQAFLKAIDSSPNDWAKIDLTALPADLLMSYKADLHSWIAAQREGCDSLLIKEPRLCRMADPLLDVLDAQGMQTRIILPLRNPLEVARSLEVRDKTPLREGLLIWLRHVLDAERVSRGRVRSFVTYEALLADWAGQTRRMGRDLGLDALQQVHDHSEAVDAFINPTSRHHSISEHALHEIGYTAGMVLRAHETLTLLCANPDAAAPMAQCDALRRDLDEIEALTLPLLRDQVQILETQQAELNTQRSHSDDLARRLTAQVTVLRDLQKSVDEMNRSAQGHIRTLSAQVAERDRRLRAHAVRVKTQEAQEAQLRTRLTEAFDRLRAEQARAHAEKTHLQAQQASLRAELNGLRRSTSWRITAPLRGLGGALGRLRRGRTPTS